MSIPLVERGRIIQSFEQNALITQVNKNTEDIATLLSGSPGGGGNSGDIEAAIEAHVTDPTPHPIYDEIPSLTVLFENGLV